MLNVGNLFILGDSYSTFEGYIPQNYVTYYTNAGRPETDVNHVSQTWWYQFVHETGSHLLLNCSWSGTTVCNTGYQGKDTTGHSFIGRLDKLIENNYFKENQVDTAIIFGGTNDSWANSPIGELKYSDWTKQDLYSVLPAFCYLLHQAVRHLNDTKVVCVINTGLKPEIAEGFRTACKYYGIDFIELSDIDKQSGHPTIAGMAQIKDQIVDYFKLR